ncbi:MAG: YerC/YecD family TrpR-related protein [Acidobacteriota bacterium]
MERELKKNRALWELFETIAELANGQECARFFRDLCTITELEAMAERWQVARMVAQEIPYRQISRHTGASTATVTRVAQWLHHGEGGYRAALEALATQQSRDCKGAAPKKAGTKEPK